MLRVFRSAASATLEEAAAGSSMTLRAARRALSGTVPVSVIKQLERPRNWGSIPAPSR